MAELTLQQRLEVWADCMVNETKVGGFTVAKDELRAAVDAIDTWLDGAAATANAAIPQPARGALTTRQKYMLLAYVALKRARVRP